MIKQTQYGVKFLFAHKMGNLSLMARSATTCHLFIYLVILCTVLIIYSLTESL